MDCREQSTVAICSEMDSEWVYCSAPESGIQLLADTINHCCPGWSSAHTTTTTSADTTMMMNRGRRMSLATRQGNDAFGPLETGRVRKLDKVLLKEALVD